MTGFTLPSWATYCILFFSAFLFVLLFSCTTSPMYEHYPFWFYGDSGIFQEMGVCLVQGGTPYVDLFDHKGPILWFIQALGIWIGTWASSPAISPQCGLVFLQTITLFATLIIWHKTISLFSKKQVFVYLIIGLGLFFLMCFYLRGNLCEEWSLPFISLPIYLYLKRNKENTTFSFSDAFIIGLCIGILALIRMNNMAPFLGFVLWFFVITITNNRGRGRLRTMSVWKQATTNAMLMFAGAIVVFIPCLLFYYYKSGWLGIEEMLYGTFGFNFTYMSGKENWNLIQWLQYYIPMVGFLVIACLCVTKENLKITIPLIISYIITYLTFGNRMFYHYIMIFIPLFLVTLCFLFQTMSKIGLVFFGIVIIQCYIVGYNAMDCLAHRMLRNPVNTELYDGFHRFVSSLSPAEKKSIHNENLNHIGPGLFAKENIYQCNRFLYKHHYESSPRLRDYYETHRIEDLQPVWVLTQSPRPEATDEYLTTHYTLADSIPGGEFDPIWCWKKNKN